MEPSSKEIIKIKEEKFKEKIEEIHYDKNKNYSLNDYINLETLSLFTENEFQIMSYNEKLNSKRIWTCQKEIIEKLLDEDISKVSNKIIQNLHKINKDEYINVLDFSHIKAEDYENLKIVEKIPYFSIQEFVEEFCIPEKWEDMNTKWKKLLESKFSIGRISSILSFFATWFYLLYARRYGLFLIAWLLLFIFPPFQILFRLYVAFNLPRLCYEWDAPNMREFLAKNYEQWIYEQRFGPKVRLWKTSRDY